jgi:hypothetical protein
MGWVVLPYLFLPLVFALLLLLFVVCRALLSF